MIISGTKSVAVRFRLIIILGVICVFAACGLAKGSASDRIHARQANAWAAFYAGKYAQALQIVKPLVHSSYHWPRHEAAHCKARCLWAAGGNRQQGTGNRNDKAGNRQQERQKKSAIKIWAKLDTKLAANRARLEIAKALQLAVKKGKGNSDRAIRVLEGVMRPKPLGTCTAEAGIELARLYAAANRMADAKKTLRYVIGYLDKPKRLEITTTATKPFIAIAKKLLKTLKAPGLPASAGQEAFQRAERLRLGHKRKRPNYNKAIRAYALVIKNFPATDYAPRSILHIGHCLTATGKIPQAIAHWEKFIAESPAGPWRGYAYLGIIDCYLEGRLDLTQSAKYVELAKKALGNGRQQGTGNREQDKKGRQQGAGNRQQDEKGRQQGTRAIQSSIDNRKSTIDTWSGCAFDIHLRAGIIALANTDTPAAIEAFSQARTACSLQRSRKSVMQSTQKGLTLIIACLEANRPILPKEILEKSKIVRRKSTIDNRKSTIALLVGTVYSLVDRYEHGKNFFNRVLKGQTGKINLAQKSYATFGLARCLENSRAGGRQKFRNCRAAQSSYKKSLQLFPAGTWHDETLYRLAMLIQTTVKRGAKSEERKTVGRRAKSVERNDRKAKRLTPHSRSASRSSLLALRYWRELLERYPKSPFAAPALYNIAQYYQATEQWPQAVKHLTKFVETFPRAAACGLANIRTIDITLERLFDLTAARLAATRGIKWIESYSPSIRTPQSEIRNRNDFRELLLTDWNTPLKPKALKRTQYELYLRAGLVAYLDQKYDEAQKHFKSAGPQKPPTQSTTFGGKDDLCRMGLHYLIKAVARKKSLTDEKALAEVKNDQQRVAIQLADIYIQAIRPEKAEKIFIRIANRDPLFGKTHPGIEGYAISQLAVALDRQRGKRPEALVWLKKLCGRRYKGTYWGGYGLFRLALFTYNLKQDPSLSLPLYQQFLRLYPKHPMRELAHYYAIADACGLKDRKLSNRLAESFRKTYPKSKWLSSIATRIKKLENRSN